MSQRFGRGLVIGKLSPLHRGHELLLRTALQHCERVYCVSYSNPELPGCDAAARRRWMAELFPTVEHLALDATLDAVPHNAASELEHRQFVARICLERLGTLVDAVFTSEHYGPGFAAQLERDFQAAGHGAAKVEHVLVDLERRAVPISASQLREQRALHREFLSPVVRASFVRRICLLGGESSGKTTLARRLAQAFATTYVEEYGRELWVERGGTLDFADYVTIARTQVEHEEQVARSADDLLFCDTSPLTTLLYCLEQFGRAEPELHALAARPYYVTLLCAPDFPFVQDGTRRDEAFRTQQHARYVSELARRNTPYLLVEGSLESRVEQALTRLR